MSARYGLLGGEMLGDRTMKVLDPQGLALYWEKQAVLYQCKVHCQSIPDTCGEVVYLMNDRNTVFLWIWYERDK